VLAAEDIPVIAANGHVLAEDVRSDRDVPPFTNSAMDGYALRAADTSGAVSYTHLTLPTICSV